MAFLLNRQIQGITTERQEWVVEVKQRDCDLYFFYLIVQNKDKPKDIQFSIAENQANKHANRWIVTL